MSDDTASRREFLAASAAAAGSIWLAASPAELLASLDHALPLETNRVELDPALKDDWGLPGMRVTYKDHDDDLATMRFLMEKATSLLNAAGAKRVWGQPVTAQQNGLHLLGTCRMGNDPQTSVIDKFHRTHDVRNLFLCDGSSLVTSGRGQPTCTIQALAYRAGDHIARFARRGEI